MTENTITLTDEHGNVIPAAAGVVYYIRAEVNGAPKWSAYVETFGVTRETVKHHAAALAALAYPKDEQVQKIDGVRTRYGNAVQAAGNGLRRALGKGEKAAVDSDYLAAVVKAANKAIDHEVDAAAVLEAVQAWAKDVLS